MSDPTLSEVQEKIRKFAELRDWGQFHTPKNLAMAIGSEAGELLDTMLWVDGEQSRNPDDKTKELIKEEVADVMIEITANDKVHLHVTMFNCKCRQIG